MAPGRLWKKATRERERERKREDPSLVLATKIRPTQLYIRKRNGVHELTRALFRFDMGFRTIDLIVAFTCHLSKLQSLRNVPLRSNEDSSSSHWNPFLQPVKFDRKLSAFVFSFYFFLSVTTFQWNRIETSHFRSSLKSKYQDRSIPSRFVSFSRVDSRVLFYLFLGNNASSKLHRRSFLLWGKNVLVACRSDRN